MPSPAPGETTLAERLEAGPLRPEAVARIGRQACRRLAASPLTVTTRRELCPAAIYLDTSPAGGVEVAVRSPGPERRAPRSPMYLSPEQVTHASPPDARSDVYSVSMVLYEALSGVLPLPRCATEGELLTALVTHDPEPLAASAPWLDPALCQVVDRGLAREPSRRWPSLRELGEALLPFTGGSEHISADMLAGITAGERVLRTRARAPAVAPRRDLRLVRVVLAGVVVLVAGGAYWVRRPSQTALVESARSAAPTAPPAAQAHRFSKKEVALALLDEPSFMIHLDPRRPGVLVPERFRTQAQLVLQVGKALALPIPDLVIDDTGISGTLSFSRAPFLCKIPWSAVYGLVNEAGRGQVWNEDVPPEVAAQMAKVKAAGDAGPD